MIDSILEFLGLNTELLRLMFGVIGDWWWLVAPPVLFLVLLDTWIMTKEREFMHSIEWTLLEIRLPKEVTKTPKAMEQVFAGLHGIYDPPRWDQTLFMGKVQYWYSFEIMGRGSEGMRFFVRTPVQYRNFVEAQVYGQYPEAELSEVEDYVWDVPRRIPNEEYDLWGTEMIMSKPDGYPVRTYLEFEAVVEEQRLDPLGGFAEAMNKLRPGEQLWLQILIAPTGEAWKEEGLDLVDTLMHRKEQKKGGGIAGMLASPFQGLANAMLETILGVFGIKLPPPTEKKPEKPLMQLVPAVMLFSAGERAVIEAIEHNISKIGFDTRIRWIYVAKRDVFSRSNIAVMSGFFKIFNTLDLNGFKFDFNTRTYVRRWFKAQREYWRKVRILPNFRNRRLYMSGSFMKKRPTRVVLNIEELATVYHLPGIVVGAPLMPRIDSRRGEPPTGLPIE